MNTILIVGKSAPKTRVRRLESRVRVISAPEKNNRVDLVWLLRRLGAENITSVLAEGGGELNGALFEQRLANRIAFFYAPKVLGGRDSIRAVGGRGANSLEESLALTSVEWRRVGPDLFLQARIA